jgi:hypothetical protein
LLQVRHAWLGIGLGRLVVSDISLVVRLAEPIRVGRGSVTLCYLFVMTRICHADQLRTRLVACYRDIPA